MNSDEQMVVSKLDRLSALVFARDPTVVDELWCDLGFILRGSERGEGTETRDELVACEGNPVPRAKQVVERKLSMTPVCTLDKFYANSHSYLNSNIIFVTQHHFNSVSQIMRSVFWVTRTANPVVF